jgi:hypothetical protein
MDNEYDNLFNINNDNQYTHLFRESSMEIDKYFMNQLENKAVNVDYDYDFKMDEFRVDRSDTKSNSKNPSPHYQFNVDSK